MPQPSKHERVAVFIFGSVFVIAILVLAIAFPEPTAFQYTVFRIVLALAAAGVAAFIPGFMHVEINTWLRAGGAMAVFAVVYFFSPAELIYKPEVPKPGQEFGFVTESAEPRDDGSVNLYFTVWNRHPYEKLRLTGVKLKELKRIPTVAYCCPETRSELKLNIDLSPDAENPSGTPLGTTYEIPPLSSHTFIAKVTVARGVADNNPVVWFGLNANYSTPSGEIRVARSDKIYLANANKTFLPVEYSESDLSKFPQRNDSNKDFNLDFLALDKEISQSWFFGKPSDGK